MEKNLKYKTEFKVR